MKIFTILILSLLFSCTNIKQENSNKFNKIDLKAYNKYMYGNDSSKYTCGVALNKGYEKIINDDRVKRGYSMDPPIGLIRAYSTTLNDCAYYDGLDTNKLLKFAQDTSFKMEFNEITFSAKDVVDMIMNKIPFIEIHFEQLDFNNGKIVTDITWTAFYPHAKMREDGYIERGTRYTWSQSPIPVFKYIPYWIRPASLQWKVYGGAVTEYEDENDIINNYNKMPTNRIIGWPRSVFYKLNSEEYARKTIYQDDGSRYNQKEMNITETEYSPFQ